MQYLRYENGKSSDFEGPVIEEISLTLYINQQEFATLQCTPTKLTPLIAGFLYNEGFIDSMADVALLRVCEEDEVVDARLNKAVELSAAHRTLTSGCGGGVSLLNLDQVECLNSDLTMPADHVFQLVRKLYEGAELHREVGGVHTSALSDGENLLFLAEDIGRHNTIDKLSGECLLRGIPSADKVLITTGRISAEMLLKAAKMRTPVLISRTSPTSMAVEMARQLNVTIVGYVRGKYFNIYSGERRIIESPASSAVTGMPQV